MPIKAQEPLKDPIHPMLVNPYHAPIRLEEFTPDFMKMTQKLEAFWKAQGIEWKFGIEHEFQWGDVEGDAVQEAEDARNDASPDPRSSEKRLDEANNRLRRYVAQLKEMEGELKELSPRGCREMLLELRLEHHIGFGITDEVVPVEAPYLAAGSMFLDVPDGSEHSSAQMIRDEAMMISRIYHNRLRLRDELRQHFDRNVVNAKQSYGEHSEELKEAQAKRAAIETFELREMIMCWMHELSPLKDKLEYVFGKGTGGEGYYDNEGVGEMRLKPASPSEAALLQRELVIALSQAAYDYGIGLRHSPNPHLHISAHKDGQTLTDSRVTQTVIQMPDKDGLPDPKNTRQMNHKTFREQVINGMLALGHDTMPMWKNSAQFRTEQFVMLTGQSRRNSIRQLPNRIEFRMNALSNLNPNIAELIAIAFAGATYGITDHEPAKSRAKEIGATMSHHGRFRCLKRHTDVSDDQMECLQDLLSVSNFEPNQTGQSIREGAYHLEPSQNQNLLIDENFAKLSVLFGVPINEMSAQMAKHELSQIEIVSEATSSQGSDKPRLKMLYSGSNEKFRKALSGIRCDRLVPGVYFSDAAVLARQLGPLIQSLPHENQPMATDGQQQLRLLETMKKSPHVESVFKQWGAPSFYEKLMQWDGDWFPGHTPDFEVSDVRYRERIAERHSPDVSKKTVTP